MNRERCFAPLREKHWRSIIRLLTTLFIVDTTLLCTVALYAQSGTPTIGTLLQDLPSIEQSAQRSVYAKYGPLKTQKYVEKQNAEKQMKILEGLAEALSAHLHLPSPIVLTQQECGRSAAFYDPQTRVLIFCYELDDEIYQQASRDFGKRPEFAFRMYAGAFTFVLFHELGHH